MNKKLLFLLCIVINGSSMSLFGMESKGDEKKENQKFDNENWQPERKKRIKELNKEIKKKQNEKVFEEYDVCIIDGNPYLRPKGRTSWSSMYHYDPRVEFDFNEEQMKKKIDIDGEDFLDGKRYYHRKEKNYWFLRDFPDRRFTDEDFHKKQKEEQEKLAQQKQKNQKSPEQKILNTNNAKSQIPDKQNPLQEWQHTMQKQIEAKELAIKKGLPEPEEGQILPKKPTEFDKNQIQKININDIDKLLICDDGKKLFHHKKENFWFDENMSKVVLNFNFEEIEEKIEKREQQKKPDTVEKKQEKIYIDAMHNQEEINNAIKRAQNLQKNRNEKTIKQLKEQTEPGDINLKKCETFNPGYAKKLEFLEQKSLNVDAKPLEQNSDSKTNSQKPWIFRNPNLEKQKNQNEPNDNVVVKNEITFKDLENSKLIWVKDPDKKARSTVREKNFYKDEKLIEQDEAKNQRPSEWAYGPNYELKVLKGDDAKLQKQDSKYICVKRPHEHTCMMIKEEELDNFRKENIQKYGEDILILDDAKTNFSPFNYKIFKEKDKLKWKKPDQSYEQNASAKLSAKLKEQTFNSEDNLSLAGHGDFNIQEQDINSNDNFWELLNHIPKNQKENNNFKLFGYEIFNSSDRYEYPKPYQYKDHEFEKEHKKFQQQTPDEAQREAAKKTKKEAAERARRAWLRELKTADQEGIKEGTKHRAMQRTIAQKSIKDAFHEGAIAGLEQGTATIVVNLMALIMQVAIEKGIEWWNQPNGQELAQLAEKIQLQQFIEALEEGIEKNQKSLENISPVVTTIGNNVERAQLIFEKQLKQKRKELIDEINNNEQVKKAIHSELELIKKRNLIKFKQNSAQKQEELIKKLKKQHGISSSPSGEQAKKLEESIQNLKKDMSQKEQQFIDAQEAEYTLEKQQEKYIQEALNILSQKSPEAKFYAVHDEINDRVLEVLQSQRAMMNAAADNARRALFNGKPAKAA